MQPNVYDDLLKGLSFDDLITTVHSNEPIIDEASVKRCFNEMLSGVLEDAHTTLKRNLTFIIKQAAIGRNE